MSNFNLSNIDKNNVNLINPLVLAYIGDSVFEVYVRTRVVNDGMLKTNKLHRLAKENVKAKNRKIIWNIQFQPQARE